jgi:glycosyl-4,4'-diaponeurosporenoate acyltransferase
LNIRKHILLYFKPKTFELYKDRTIYELIGIKTFKKYLPTTGDIVRKKRKIVQIKIGALDKVNELYKYEKQTRNYEWRHLVGALVFILFTLMIERKFTVFDWLFVTLFNLYVNIYPIFLQRHNRIRIIKVLQKNERLSPYEL